VATRGYGMPLLVGHQKMKINHELRPSIGLQDKIKREGR